MKIVFWTGQSWEPWGPTSIDKGGIGGSETAAISMSRELNRLGHEVVMIGQHEPCLDLDVHSSNGLGFVTYVPFQEVSKDRSLLDCDVLISSRDKSVVRLNPQARLKILWCHDVNCGDDWENDLPKFDKIFTLSQWASQTFLNYYEGSRYLLAPKIHVTRNGIDVSRYKNFIPSEGRPPHFVYSSSPDRGLALLLDLWPKIREIREDAELRVYYGFDTWKKMVERSKSKTSQMQIAWFTQRLLEMGTQGVYYKGRVGQGELAEAQRHSILWTYPTHFKETACLHQNSMISVPGDHREGLPVRVPIKSLAGKKNIPVYCFDETEKRFRIGTMLRCWKTKIAKEMVAITLDDGSALRVTADHLVMNFDGEWIKACQLKPGNRLMALHHRYEVFIKDYTGAWRSESRLVGEWMEGRPLTNKEHAGKRWKNFKISADKSPQNHKVIGIKMIPGGPVYDMEVADYHTFIADGVVVHNCISAMEAQAAGAVPVTSKLAALAETVKHGVLVDLPTTGPAYAVEFLAHVKSLLGEDSEKRKDLAEAGHRYATENLSWAKVASEWSELFQSELTK